MPCKSSSYKICMRETSNLSESLPFLDHRAATPLPQKLTWPYRQDTGLLEIVIAIGFRCPGLHLSQAVHSGIHSQEHHGGKEKHAGPKSKRTEFQHLLVLTNSFSLGELVHRFWGR